MSGRLRRIAIDVTPLRVSHDFRLLWTGSLISALGTQFTRVALYVQVYALTGSPAQVGLLGVSALAGNVAGTFIGGSFIDAHDRRQVLIWTQVGHMAVSGGLVAGAIGGHPPLVLLHVANMLTWGLGAIDGAARQAATPRLVGNQLMPSAVALNQVLWQITGIVGPAVRESLRYVGHHRLIRSTFVIDLIAMIFGMPAALFPVLAVEQFHRGPAVVGLLFAAPAVGALAQLLVAGSVTRIRRQGEAVIWAVAGWGAAIAAFGLVGAHLGWALVFLALAGAADVVSAIFRSTILQVSIPDALRGRLGGIFLLVVSGGPKVGDLEAGIVAAAVSPAFSVVSGGIACIVGAFWCAVRYPELRRYDAGARPAATG
jgi:MFS family permease